MKPIVVAAVMACLGVGVGAIFLVNKPASSGEEASSGSTMPAAAPVHAKPLELPQGVAPINGIEAVYKRLDTAIRATKNESELRALASECQAAAFDIPTLPELKSPPLPLEAQKSLVEAFEYLGLAAKISLTSENPDKVFKAAQESLDKAKQIVAKQPA